MSSLDHILLYTLLFSILFLLTLLPQSSINKNYKLITLVPILCFSLVFGMRNWGVDYEAYKIRFQFPMAYADEDPAFRLLNILLKDYLGLNYVGGFVAYAFLTVLCAYIACRKFKENKYMLALYVPAILLFSATIVRQSLAFAFTLIGITSLQRREYFLSGVMLVISYLFHPVAAIVYIITVVLYYTVCKLKPFALKYTIPAYIAVIGAQTFLMKYTLSYILKAEVLMSMIGGKFTSYSDNAEQWFGEEVANSDRYQEGLIVRILIHVFNLAVIYLGSLSLKYKNNNAIMRIYNIVIIGIIAYMIGFNVELLRRVATPIYILYFIPLGYSLSFMQTNYKLLTRNEKRIGLAAVFCIIIYLVAIWSNFIIKQPDLGFYWNS